MTKAAQYQKSLEQEREALTAGKDYTEIPDRTGEIMYLVFDEGSVFVPLSNGVLTADEAIADSKKYSLDPESEYYDEVEHELLKAVLKTCSVVSDTFQTSGNSPTHSGGTQPDFVIEDHGSIFLLKPQTDSAISWVEEHIGPENGFQSHYPHVLVVEHQYIGDIVAGIQSNGLAVIP
jgi:hypothetical protein